MYFEYQSILISPHSYITTEQTNGENTLMIFTLHLELIVLVLPPQMFFNQCYQHHGIWFVDDTSYSCHTGAFRSKEPYGPFKPKATLTKISGSGHLTDSPTRVKVKKVWIWQLGFYCSILGLVSHFESSPVHAKNFFQWIKNHIPKLGNEIGGNPSTINNFLRGN